MKEMFCKVLFAIFIVQVMMKAFINGGGRNSKRYLSQCVLYLKGIKCEFHLHQNIFTWHFLLIRWYVYSKYWYIHYCSLLGGLKAVSSSTIYSCHRSGKVWEFTRRGSDISHKCGYSSCLMAHFMMKETNTFLM